MTHNRSQSFTRLTRTVLVAGLTPLHLTDHDEVSIALQTVITVLSDIHRNYSGSDLNPIRILTGFSEGTDEIAAAIAETLKLPLHIIAPYPLRSNAHAERVSVVTTEVMRYSLETLVATAA